MIVVGNTGDYRINFSVTAIEPNQFGLTVNGLETPQSTYGSGAGTQQNTGQLITHLNAGDALTLRNVGSFTGVQLQPSAGGNRMNVDASIIVEQLD
jgi:hypothetical protein